MPISKVAFGKCTTAIMQYECHVKLHSNASYTVHKDKILMILGSDQSTFKLYKTAQHIQPWIFIAEIRCVT